MMPEEELSEKDFIQESYKKDPWGLWGTFAFTLLVAALIWGISAWKESYVASRVTESPYHQVSNRAMSLFLYQNPEYMRAHRRSKNGYLPDFDYEQRVGIKLGRAEAYVQAPPSLLFRYHVWDRLVGDVVPTLVISPAEFQEFLISAPEWNLKFWKEAPSDYVALVNGLEGEDSADLFDRLPVVVRQAFSGWKNYFKEGDAISELTVTAREMKRFLRDNPQYQRNYWRNLYLSESFESPYLASLDAVGDTTVLEDEELPSFLRAAYFNSRVRESSP